MAVIFHVQPLVLSEVLRWAFGAGDYCPPCHETPVTGASDQPSPTSGVEQRARGGVCRRLRINSVRRRFPAHNTAHTTLRSLLFSVAFVGVFVCWPSAQVRAVERRPRITELTTPRPGARGAVHRSDSGRNQTTGRCGIAGLNS